MGSELEEAEATYAKAVDQIRKWSKHDTGFAKQQVELWTEIMKANKWCLPGASSAGIRNDR